MSELIVIRGPIGAGKTSLMHELAQELPQSTMIEIDTLKRMLDSRKSTQWRRDTAFSTALYMTNEALRAGRTVIAETHSKLPVQQRDMQSLAHSIPGATFRSVLVVAPLELCIERAQQRYVPGISYAIDSAMVESYYEGLDPLPDELVIDTSIQTIASGVQKIVKALVNI